jgi:repressor LexA
MKPLSPRQSEVLAFLVLRMEEGDRPPSQVEMAEHFGIRRNAITDHLAALAGKGYIELVPNSARGVRVLALPPDLVAAPAANQLPLLGRIAAGTPITAAENIEEWITVDPALFRPRATQLFRVSGRSMLNVGVLDGDIVAIHEDADAASGIVAAAVPDYQTDDLLLTLKRYVRRRGRIQLLSENDDQDAFPPQVYEPGDVRVLGRYVGLIRPEHRR